MVIRAAFWLIVTYDARSTQRFPISNHLPVFVTIRNLTIWASHGEEEEELPEGKEKNE